MLIEKQKYSATRKILIVIAVFFLLLPLDAWALISLGSVSDTHKTVYSSPGRDIMLKYSFFNSGSENLNLKVRFDALNDGTKYDLVDYDNKMHLMYDPYPSTFMNALYLTLPPLTKSPDSSSDKEWIALDGGTNYAEVKGAYLFIQIPEQNIHANPYRLKVVATTYDASDPSDTQNTTSIQKVVQQREYIVRIYNDAERIELIPDSRDSDNDGLSDKKESETYHTNPYKKDTDGDGISDGDEVRGRTDPNDPDDPGRGMTSSGTLFDTLRNMAGFESNDLPGPGANESSDQEINNDVSAESREDTNTGGNYENIERNEDTPEKSDENNYGPTGLFVDMPASGPVNVATVIIIILGALLISRLLKSKV
ncbi:MAG: hypothetical protein DRN71_01950 [Candidatus Nanohalarchaeota archaeon]|nr:MAG: hypothetical protein DRN71_01950 [Candidatus Nanohaloarchaeota archaeon]